MRYLVQAKVKPGSEQNLLQAIADGTLGRGSVAGDEYLHNMREARISADGTVTWVEVCFCNDPLHEERPYWEKFFEIIKIEDAHPRVNCRDSSGKEPWACSECVCTRRLEEDLAKEGSSFLNYLKANAVKT